jgi:hypothetical protein
LPMRLLFVDGSRELYEIVRPELGGNPAGS